MRITSTVLVMTGLVAGLASPVFAQTQRSGGGGGGNSQMMQQFQQVSAERATLKAENDRLKKEADDAKAQLTSIKKERDELKSKVGGLASEAEKARSTGNSAEQTLADTRRKLDELVARYKETATTLRTVESDKVRAEEALARSTQGLDKCASDNVVLYDLNGEILQRWEKEGLFSRAARAEPVTRLKQIQVENLIDGYRERANEAKVKAATHRANALGDAPRN